MLPLLGVLAPLVGDVIKRFIPDEEAARQAEDALKSSLVDNAAKIETAAASIVQAEAQSEHFLAANWRPITALTFVFIIANNFIIAPYLGFFGVENAPMLEIPEQMWSLLNIMIGGYVVSRGAEKGIKHWKG